MEVVTPTKLPKNPSNGGGGGGNVSVSKVAKNIVSVGSSLIGRTKYVFGGGRNSKDIASGKFDCSSFIHHAFKQSGIDLGNVTSVTTDTLKHKGSAVSSKNMKYGDLVFFDTYKKDGHVGIYLGNGQFLGAQSSTGVAVANMSDGYWASKFNGNVRRVI